MSKTFLILSRLLIVSYSSFINDIEYLTEINNNVVIGIFTQQSGPDSVDYPFSQYSYLAVYYVKFVEMAGVRVHIPIPYEADNTVGEIFLKVNGIINLYGIQPYHNTHSVSYKFAKAIAYILLYMENQFLFMKFVWDSKLQITSYQLQNSIPLQSLWRGRYWQLILTVCTIQAINQKMEIEICFIQGFDDYTYQAIQTNSYFYYNAFFRITGINQDSKGQTFVAFIQGKQYPVFGVQYHPEKNILGWKVSAPDSNLAVKV